MKMALQNVMSCANKAQGSIVCCEGTPGSNSKLSSPCLSCLKANAGLYSVSVWLSHTEAASQANTRFVSLCVRGIAQSDSSQQGRKAKHPRSRSCAVENHEISMKQETCSRQTIVLNCGLFHQNKDCLCMQGVNMRSSALGDSADGTIMNFTLARPGDYSKCFLLLVII